MQLHSLLESSERLSRAIANLDVTLSTIDELIGAGAVPSGDELKKLWLAHEKLETVYGAAEGARRK